jgi:UDP-N-acetylmuramoyl-tripeptide--D-alanyl-D-alanine ligase
VKPLFDLHEILSVTRGAVVSGDPKGDLRVTSVAVDSRKILSGGCFIALPGEKVDGHDFAEDAAMKGSRIIVVNAAEGKNRLVLLHGITERHGTVVVAVDNTLKALQDLAAHHLLKMKKLVRIGVTGSNGKTTTKEIIGSVLKLARNTVMNEGNLNSDIGLPLSVLNVTEEHEYGVFEMGMNRKGEMEELADVLRPQLAVITNIGTAHIGLLGSRDAIAAEKKKIFKNFTGSCKGFLNENDDYYGFLKMGIQGAVIPFGLKSTRGYEGHDNQGLDGVAIDWEGLRIHFPLPGFHNLLNALAAISLCGEMGIAPSLVKQGLESVTPLFGRSQIIKGPVTVIADCYNANPDSMSNALQFFRELPWNGRKIAVLGGMRELGSEGPAAHRELAALAAGMKFDRLFFFGEELAGSPANGTASWTGDFGRLAESVSGAVRAGDLVLLKGSRGLELERLLPFLKAIG